jgi:sulfur carrier protein
MQVLVNGETKTFNEPLSVTDLLDLLAIDEGFVAVALNGDFVPRSTYESTTVNEGDAVECVAPRQGG